MSPRSLIPTKYTRDQIEWRIDELAIAFQKTPDEKTIRRISALGRLLAKLKSPSPDRRDYN